MKLPEILDVLLKAEDEASLMRDGAEQDAKTVVQKAHEKFAEDQEARLNAARGEARAQVESARHSAEIEALHIAELAQKARERMREHFDEAAPALIGRMSGEIAARYAAQGRA